MAAAPTGPSPLQAMDLTTLRAVLSELRPLLLPSRFEKAQQSDGATIQIGLRTLEGMTWLELSWLAEAPRILVIPPPHRQGDGSTLAQQLQHGLRGLALVSLEQHGWERVVELGFARRPGDPIQRSLVLELMGRHSNLFLLDGERRVMAIGRRVRQDQSRLRPIAAGDPYSPPPPMAGEPPRPQESLSSWRKRLCRVPLPLSRALMQTYQGISPTLSRQLCSGIGTTQPVTALTAPQWQTLWNRWQDWLTCLEAERFSLHRGDDHGYRCWVMDAADGPQAQGKDALERYGDDGAEPLPINRGLARYYSFLLGQRRLAQSRHSLRQRLLSAMAREQGEVRRQEDRLAAVPGGPALRQEADALLSLAAPSRDQVRKAQSLYHQARRLQRSQASITPRLELHRQRLQWLEESLTFLEQADLDRLERPPPSGSAVTAEAEQALAALEEELQELGPRAGEGGQGRRLQGIPQPLELRSVGGVRLQIGRNHRQNEWISLRQARRGDLWFHAQECPGSHVVLKASERPADDEDVAAAADLAAHFSRGRGNSRVPVVMVPTEDLQRIPGAAPGTVRHRGGAILWGRPQRALDLLDPPTLGAE